MCAIGPNFILIDDNARPHRALVTNANLEHETIVPMDWPARSLDLNPIEHALGNSSAWNFSQTCATQDFKGA